MEIVPPPAFKYLHPKQSIIITVNYRISTSHILIRICVDKIIKKNEDPYDDSWNLRATMNSYSGIRRKWWNVGQALRIRFLGGDIVVIDKVKKMAMVWMQHANLNLQFVENGDSDIRIDFQTNGSWSYIGTDAKYVSQNQPTMNYGWLQKDTEDREYNVVLHEFGHALGLIHELQVPGTGIPWNKEAVYDYFSSAPYYWRRETVDQEIFERYSRSYSNSSYHDQNSIMLYSIPNDFVRSDFEIGWNTGLSSGDIAVIGAIYPYRIGENELLKDDKHAKMHSNNPLEILKLRLAKGEISIEEFLKMRHILES